MTWSVVGYQRLSITPSNVAILLSLEEKRRKSKVIVQTASDHIHCLVRRGGNRCANVDRIVHDEGVITKVEIEILDLGSPLRHECVFHAAARGPSDGRAG